RGKHQREVARPARRRRALLDGLARPPLRVAVGEGELAERVRLADAPAQLIGHDLDLIEQALVALPVVSRALESTLALLPLLPQERRAVSRHRRRMLLRRRKCQNPRARIPTRAQDP